MNKVQLLVNVSSQQFQEPINKNRGKVCVRLTEFLEKDATVDTVRWVCGLLLQSVNTMALMVSGSPVEGTPYRELKALCSACPLDRQCGL